jgi:hypothetical protein
VLSASNSFLFNGPLAESTLEAMRTQGVRKTLTHPLCWHRGCVFSDYKICAFSSNRASFGGRLFNQTGIEDNEEFINIEFIGQDFFDAGNSDSRLRCEWERRRAVNSCSGCVAA